MKVLAASAPTVTQTNHNHQRVSISNLSSLQRDKFKNNHTVLINQCKICQSIMSNILLQQSNQVLLKIECSYRPQMGSTNTLASVTITSTTVNRITSVLCLSLNHLVNSTTHLNHIKETRNSICTLTPFSHKCRDSKPNRCLKCPMR